MAKRHTRGCARKKRRHKMPTITRKTVSLVAVIGLAGAGAVLARGEMSHESAVTACNADATAVETAIAEFNAVNPGITPTPKRLTTTILNGKPYLKSWPKGGALYTVSLSSTGAVRVAVPSTARAVSYDTANPCPSAG
jgi:hypothetical protein